jgi:hypothetical protein
LQITSRKNLRINGAAREKFLYARYLGWQTQDAEA